MENQSPIAPPPEWPAPAATEPAAPEIPPEMRLRIHSAANWFFWIAAFSLINSIIAHTGSTWNFIIGLAVTQIVDAILSAIAGTTGAALAFFFDLIIALVFVGIGALARRFQHWAFILGMILYAIDGLILLAFGEYLGFAFHLFALYSIFSGFRLLQQHRRETVLPH